MKKSLSFWIYIIILFCSIFFNFVLFFHNRKCIQTEEKKEILYDTLHVVHADTLRLNIYNDSIRELKFDLQSARDSIRFYRDKMDMSYDCYSNARRVEKSKYYISICDKNEGQKKYFFGWIKRTMSE